MNFLRNSAVFICEPLREQKIFSQIYAESFAE